MGEWNVLIECHVLKGEELIEIGARGRGWFLCRAFGVGRREINMQGPRGAPQNSFASGP